MAITPVQGKQIATASWAVNAISSSYSATASYAPNYLPLAGGTINGNVTINGTASISFLNVTIESASIIYSTGSNQLGDATNDTQTLIGTVIVSGSQRITGSLNVSQGITGSLFGTSSWAINANLANTASIAYDLVDFSAATVHQINVGEVNHGTYAYVVKAQELEQSKHTTINIYNNLNFI